jgi:hypothetical protein
MMQEAPQYMYETSPYVQGSIKLTWIDPTNYNILNSEIFQTIDEALKNTKGKNDWLVFRLAESDGNKYKWELLPFGESKNYINSMKTFDFVEKYGLYVLIGFGVLILMKD